MRVFAGQRPQTTKVGLFSVLLALGLVIALPIHVFAGADPTGPQLSDDLDVIVFQSSDSDLVAGDTNGQTDIFTKQLSTGTITRVSTDASGTEANGTSQNPKITADGHYVFFNSSASNLVDDDTNGNSDDFLKNLQTGEVVRTTTNSANEQVSGFTRRVSNITPDGKYVVFTSSAADLVDNDTNSADDVFRKDLQTGETVRVSLDAEGNEGDSNSDGAGEGSIAISDDGQYVVFVSGATNLVPDDTNGKYDVFRKDMETGGIVRVNTSSAGEQANEDADAPSMSSDMRYIAFSSNAGNLISDDTNEDTDIYVKDMETGGIVRANTSSRGAESNGGAYTPQISGNGRYVVFNTYRTTNLLESGNPTNEDSSYLYAKDLMTGNIAMLTKSQSGEIADDYSFGPTISADGKHVAFYSNATNLDFVIPNTPSYEGVVLMEVAQNSVTINNTEGGQTIAIETPEGTTITCSSTVQYSDIQAKDSHNTYPLGLVNFCFDTDQGSSNQVSITFVTDFKPNQVTPRKYNSNTQTYGNVPGATVTETTLDSLHALKLTYSITDGGELDQDGQVNGAIVDPVGLAASPLASSGDTAITYMATASVLVITCVALVTRRKETATTL